MKNLFILGFVLFGLISMAQNTPTLYLIGDSTMADKKDPEQNPEHGWGQMLPDLMENITIINKAVNGRSTKSFIDEGKWQEVLNSLKPGDFVFIQFGHNDQKFKDSTRYTNPFTQYWHNLERYVNETRAKFAIPILFSSIVRRNFNEYGVLVDTHDNYPLVARMVAKEMNVPFIDLQWLTEQLELKFGPEKSKKLHLHIEPSENSYKPDGVEDNTHLSKLGANLVASLALQEIARQKLLLTPYIKQEVLEKKIL
ncbi:rhamnogalacturonan acetylesterase [Aegicerativicinus sediminis]|uniref:rhamnogalacturonan acetylesterase n=1 Tax=Aegicerativicinus sediminis TaxID=2893202 RepID=UPI001E2C347A|nr:rhamnogalacturonan acetylesterase [Aegicerativicinus sediminis]